MRNPEHRNSAEKLDLDVGNHTNLTYWETQTWPTKLQDLWHPQFPSSVSSATNLIQVASFEHCSVDDFDSWVHYETDKREDMSPRNRIKTAWILSLLPSNMWVCLKMGYTDYSIPLPFTFIDVLTVWSL